MTSQVMACDSIKQRVESIVRSPQDKRCYRGLILNNDMKIMLISDPETDKATASLVVNVGKMHDPKTIPGLAHFCKHMLFMGTKKYPDENDYEKFITNHSGFANAYTTLDKTNYYFEIQPDKLEEALDRFSRFFVEPLFTESATGREANAVNSEHLGNLQSDARRQLQLCHTLCDPDHPYYGFGTGSVKTLLEDTKVAGVDIRDELLKFHQEHYSSNLMSLALVGKDSLDDLENIVVSIFCDVENKSLSIPEWKDHPYSDKYLGNWIKIVPVKDVRSLCISFPISDLQPHHRASPGSYVSHLLGHEGKGSLLSELKNRGWANTVYAGDYSTARGFGFFDIDIGFTQEGENHLEDIVELMFQYIKLLNTQHLQEWIHRKVETMSDIRFRFKDQESPISYAQKIACNLHDYSLEEVLSGPYHKPGFDPRLIRLLVLDKMTQGNMNITVMSRRYDEVADKTETWYGTKYKVEKFSEAFIDRLVKTSVNETFFIPDKNQLIPSNFDVATESTSKLITDEPLCRVWFQQDDEFLLPKCAIYFEFKSPFVYMDPWYCNMSSMYTALLNDALTEYVYDANLAGLQYSIYSTKYGMELYVYGYSQKQHILLEDLSAKMVSFQADPNRFEILKEAYIRSLRNFKLDQPFEHAAYYSNLLLSQRCWSIPELHEATNDMTIDKFQCFLPSFLSALHIETFVHGNIHEARALQLVDIVKNSLSVAQGHVNPLFSSQIYLDREINLPEGSSHLFVAQHTTHPTSAIEMYLQCGVQNSLDNAMLDLIAQVLNEPCFDQLRTKEQLDAVEVAALQTITKNQLLDFYKKFLASTSSTRKKLSVHVESLQQGKDEKEGKSATVSETATMITDHHRFRAGLPLYPLAQPYGQVSTAGVTCL